MFKPYGDYVLCSLDCSSIADQQSRSHTLIILEVIDVGDVVNSEIYKKKILVNKHESLISFYDKGVEYYVVHQKHIIGLYV